MPLFEIELMSNLEMQIYFLGTCWVVSVLGGTGIIAWAWVKSSKIKSTPNQLTSDNHQHHVENTRQPTFKYEMKEEPVSGPAGPTLEKPKIQLDPALFKRPQKVKFGDEQNEDTGSEESKQK